MIDIVFPSHNENEFIKLAEKLGIKKLIFAYKDKKDFYSKGTAQNALLVEPKHVMKAKDTNVLAICKASREALERGADIVYGFEQHEKKDPTHFRASGLNQVLCKLATRKNARIGLSFSAILAQTGPKRAILLGRMKQNIAFCKKFRTPMKIASFATDPYQMRAPDDLSAVFQKLGMSASDTKKSLG